jgi:hypothetical protein
MSATAQTPRALTVGDLARRFNTSRSKVVYALETHRIEPAAGRAGIVRLFTESQSDEVKRALDSIASRRTA